MGEYKLTEKNLSVGVTGLKGEPQCGGYLFKEKTLVRGVIG